jgi:hypothetical protein
LTSDLELVHAGLFSATPVHETLLPIDFVLRAIHVRPVTIDLGLLAVNLALGSHGGLELGQDAAISHDVIAAILPEPRKEGAVLERHSSKRGSSRLSQEPPDESPETIRYHSFAIQRLLTWYRAGAGRPLSDGRAGVVERGGRDI